MKRPFRLAALAACLALAGFWLYRNVSIPRLRAEFVPWMRKLERWRDGIEAVRRATLRREPKPDDPKGVERVRSAAWQGLERIHAIAYDVTKPQHAPSVSAETSGRVQLTVDGFRPDGARVERVLETVVETRDSMAPFSVELLRVAPDRVEASPRFRNATAESGLGAPRNDPPKKLTNRLIDGIWPGSGVAVLDFDRDGAEDLFVGDGVRSILYRNDGTGHFTDVTGRAGFPDVAATGVAAGDGDGDGFPDLAVTDAFGPTRLFRNRGDGTFEETTGLSGVVTPVPTRSLAFADVDGDGDLDLFVCGTGDYYRQMPDPPFDANDGRRNFLFLNDGTGRFRDASREWGLEKTTRWSLSCLFADFDGDGRPDLLVTNDFGLKNLYRNVDGKRFEDVTGKTGTEDRGYGMSAAWGDFDGDGKPDLYATGTYTQWGFVHEYPGLPVPLPGRIFLPIAISWCEKMCRGNSLLLQRDGKFTDETARSGARKAGWSWSAIAADLDDDGWLDLYATNGMWGDGRDRDRELEFWWETLAYWDDYIEMKKTFDQKGAGIQGFEREMLFRGRGTSEGPVFEERAFLDGLDLLSNGRAAVAFDANGDGALDVYVRSVGAPEALFLGSRKPDEHYLRLALTGRKGKEPSDGRGARITAVLPDGRTLVREASVSSGYLSSGSPIVHLGLGRATRVAKLSVRWSSGLVEEIGPVEVVDRLLTVVAGAARIPAP